MPEFKNFSFKNVNLIFGTLQITGFAPGDDAITLELVTPQFVDLAGARGDVVRAQTSDLRVIVTVNLLQNASCNADLTNIYNIDKITRTGYYPSTLSDKESGETYFINNMYITQYPNVIRGTGVNTMQWVFRGSDFNVQYLT